MKLDEALPRFDFRERHATRISAQAGAIMQALWEVRPEEVRMLRELMWLRALPARLAGRSVLGPTRGGPVLAGALRGGFVRLFEEEERELVLGTVGRFWRLAGTRVSLDGPEAFLRFAEPGYAKAAMNFSIEPGADACTLTTETRILCTDAGARRRFGLYWALIRPGSGLLRRTWLAAVRRRAEAARGTGGAGAA